MSYIRKIKVSGKEYYVLSHNVRVGDKIEKISKYIGKKLPPKEKLKELERKFEAELKALKEPEILSSSQKETLDKIKSNYQKHIKKLGKADIDKLDEFIVTNFTYNTNAIEGSTLSLADVQTIFKGEVPEGKDLRELYGAQNMRKSYEYIKTLRNLSEKRVLELHKIAMQDILSTEVGKYRSVRVYVGNHIPPGPSKLKKQMKELFNWYKVAKKKLHPFELASILHVKFENIHPFRDGNGRVGRLIMNYVLLSNGYPLLDIRFDRRAEYYRALQKQKDEGFKPFVNYALDTYVKMARERHWL